MSIDRRNYGVAFVLYRIFASISRHNILTHPCPDIEIFHNLISLLLDFAQNSKGTATQMLLSKFRPPAACLKRPEKKQFYSTALNHVFSNRWTIIEI